MNDSFLTAEEVAEFKQIVRKTKGITLTDEQALEQGSRVIQLIELFQLTEFDPDKAIEKKEGEVQNDS